MRKLLFSFLLWVSFAPTFAQYSSKPQKLVVAKTPEAAGISSERLQRLDHSLQQFIDQNKLPGMVAIVIRNGQIVYHKALGKADVQAGRNMKTDDIFRIASMTKALTSTAAMMLYEEGKFGLDDPVSLYIPEFKNPQVLKSFHWKDSTYTTEPAKSEITIRHLLTQTSGISYGIISGDERFHAINAKAGIVDLFTTQPVKLSDNIKKLAKLPLQHNPGEKWTYGLNTDVLGYLIEIWSGMTFDQFLRTRLFEPLGMNDTYFYLPDTKKDRLVPVQKPDANQQWIKYPVTFYDPEYPIKGAKTFFSGGAGLSSTAKDYATFLQMLLNDGTFNSKRFLSRPTVELLTVSDQIGNLFGEDGFHFSMGFRVVNQQGHNKGQGSINRFAWGGYFNTNYFVDPQEKIVAILMKQTQGAIGDNSEALFVRMIYQAIND
ncbi:serine hydrolase domain-containing protein [Xanthocytophaga agilis]|uniref:Serine hydrolase domain-containing protein n=1 Tax=Xanthocytophaga agilis TaxID=3048010 RepID=A0AAE3UDH0_9BACT|nr:serine hydrolase domain-containing protein [Xanthocytophaga agilis]MDJ1499172.1 serine hydrolase domain-containing protein [Xanthocytophaga agilis]